MAGRRVGTAGSLLLAVAGLMGGLAFAQIAPPTTLSYKLTVLGEDSGGITVLQTGDIFSIRMAGILGVPPQNITCATTYQNGSWHKVSSFCSMLVKEVSVYFQPGLKVYITKVDINLKKEKISLRLVACDTCNNTDPPSYYKSELVLEFEKGYLETAKPEVVRGLVAQVLAIDTGGAQQQPAAAAPAPMAPPPPPPPPVEQALPPVAPPPPPPAETVSIEMGQSTEQVLANVGKPDKIVKLATKQIFYYKDMKVTFVNNKVTDVQ